jgi:Fic family protein
MSAILLRTESTSSSQIERLTTSAKQLALAELGEGGRSNAHVVVGNVRAMEAALRLADDLSEESILQMHHALMVHQPNVGPSEAGVYRKEFVWLGEGEAGPRTADFVPPHPDRVPHSMADLMGFLGRQDLPVLVQVAVGHAQFETIHPFVDGNGRTGRALVQSVLKNKGMVSGMAVPISAGLLTNIDRYFAALGSFRKGDAGPIVTEFARASRMAAVSGRRLLDQLSDALEDSRTKLIGVRSDAAAWRVLPSLVAQPVMTAKHLTRTLGLGEMAALRTLNLLTERRVLREVTGQRRNRIFEHGEILRVLDDYARGIKRATSRVAGETG